MNEEFLKKLSFWGLEPEWEKLEKLNKFSAHITDKNAQINLVSRKDIDNIWMRHVLDSLSFINLMPKLNLKEENLKVGDIGSGGGFPAIPLAIFLPKSNFFLFESSLRKYEFLLWIKHELSLENISVYRKRVEKTDKGDFDACIQRAAGEAREIIPLCLNLCHGHGYAVTWQYQKNIPKIEKTNKPYFIYNYSLGENDEKALLVFRRN